MKIQCTHPNTITICEKGIGSSRWVGRMRQKWRLQLIHYVFIVASSSSSSSVIPSFATAAGRLFNCTTVGVGGGGAFSLPPLSSRYSHHSLRCSFMLLRCYSHSLPPLTRLLRSPPVLLLASNQSRAASWFVLIWGCLQRVSVSQAAAANPAKQKKHDLRRENITNASRPYKLQ